MPGQLPSRARTAAVTFLAAAAAGTAGAEPVSVRSAVGGEAAEVRLTTPAVSVGYRIANDSEADASVTLTPRPTYSDRAAQCSDTGEGPCVLGWFVNGKALSLNRTEAVPLRPHETAELRFSGRVEPMGTFQSELLVTQAGTAPKSLPIRIVRVAADLGTGALTAGPWGTRLFPFSGSLEGLPIRLSNNGGSTVQLRAAPQADLLRDEGGSNYVLAGPTGSIKCGKSAAILLKPGETVSCALGIEGLSAPGRYRADLTLGGGDIGRVTAAGTFTVRFHWLVAAALLGLGGLGGAWLAGWQNSGRSRALQAADALELAQDYRAVAADLDQKGANVDAQAMVESVRGQLNTIVSDLESSRTADHGGDLTALAARLPVIHRFAGLELLYRKASAPAAASAAYADALAAAQASQVPPDVDAKLDALKAAVGGVRTTARIAGVVADAGREFFFRWPRTRSPARLRAMVSRLDIAVMIASNLLVLIIGVLTLWVPNPTWGTPSDLAIALFTGLAATVTGAVGIRELVGGYQLAKI